MKALPYQTISLYVLSVIGSGCGFLTQMLISGYWSTTFSQDVFYFSVNTAFYFLSLGIGSLQSAKWRQPTLALLFSLTLFLCLWAALTIPLLRLCIQQSGNTFVIPIALVFVTGLAAGQIIPLTLRLDKVNIRLSTLFFLDYAAAILFFLLFSFWFLIPLGYAKTGLIVGYVSLLLVALLMVGNREKQWVPISMLFVSVVLPPFLYGASKAKAIAPRWGTKTGETAKVLVNIQSHYQKIIFTEEKGNNPFYPDKAEHVLYLDGFIQFNSLYEQGYHFCLTNIPAIAAQSIGSPLKRALVLGGGDGLVARNLLALPSIERIDQVELDPTMVQIAKHQPNIRQYNKDSFHNARVHIILADAFRWVRAAPHQYDLIIIDFPDPKNITLSRLYSSEFYSHVLKLLNPKGFLSIQSGPIFNLSDPNRQTLARVPTSIMKTLASLFQHSHVYYNPRDLDAFVMATRERQFNMFQFSKRIKMLPEHNSLCRYRPKWIVPEVEVNTLNKLPLSTYLLHWYEQAGGSFFNYQGNYAVFLAD